MPSCKTKSTLNCRAKGYGQPLLPRSCTSLSLWLSLPFWLRSIVVSVLFSLISGTQPACLNFDYFLSAGEAIYACLTVFPIVFLVSHRLQVTLPFIAYPALARIVKKSEVSKMKLHDFGIRVFTSLRMFWMEIGEGGPRVTRIKSAITPGHLIKHSGWRGN